MVDYVGYRKRKVQYGQHDAPTQDLSSGRFTCRTKNLVKHQKTKVCVGRFPENVTPITRGQDLATWRLAHTKL